MNCANFRLPRLFGPLVMFGSLYACEQQNSPWEGVEIVQDECNYDPPSQYVEIAVRAHQVDDRDPRRFLLSIKLMNEGTRPISLADPRILPSYVNPQSPADPSFEGTYPPVLLRVGEINASGALASEWTVLLPTSAAPAEPRDTTLDPGTSVELSFLWMAPKPGRYTLQGMSGEFGWQAHWTTEPRCQGDVINPICYAQAFTEFHFEVPAP